MFLRVQIRDFAAIERAGTSARIVVRDRGPGLPPGFAEKAFEPFMLECIRRQLATIPTFSTCYCLGEGTNFKYFSRINARHGFFKEIIPLPHPFLRLCAVGQPAFPCGRLRMAEK